jgi:hypothetical protein
MGTAAAACGQVVVRRRDAGRKETTGFGSSRLAREQGRKTQGKFSYAIQIQVPPSN